MNEWNLRHLCLWSFAGCLNNDKPEFYGIYLLIVRIMDNIAYYGIALLMIVIGFVVLRKLAGCLVRFVVTVVLLALLAVLYYFYMK